MATPPKVKGTIWNQEMARANLAHTRIREKAEQLLDAIQQRPFPVRLAAIYIGQILSASLDCVEALRELDNIAGKNNG